MKVRVLPSGLIMSRTESVIKSSKFRRWKICDWLKEIKANSGCKICKENNPNCLQFHHRNAHEKEFNISNMYAAVMPVSKIQKEINKCDILCANCHAKIHAKERDGHRENDKDYKFYQKYIDKQLQKKICNKCQTTNINVLFVKRRNVCLKCYNNQQKLIMRTRRQNRC